MRKAFVSLLSVLAAASIGILPIITSAQAPEVPKSKIDFEKEIIPIVKANCLGCHNKDNAKHNVIFPDKMTLAEALKNPRLWTKSLREVKNQQMPPRDNGTISDKERKKFVQWATETFPKSTPQSSTPIPPTSEGGGK